jgi:hypothetical protein
MIPVLRSLALLLSPLPLLRCLLLPGLVLRGPVQRGPTLELVPQMLLLSRRWLPLGPCPVAPRHCSGCWGFLSRWLLRCPLLPSLRLLPLPPRRRPHQLHRVTLRGRGAPRWRRWMLSRLLVRSAVS